VENAGGSLENERQKMQRAYERMLAEIKTYENNIGFLTSSSKKGNTLVDAMNKKVEKLREELNLLVQKIKAVDEQMRGEKK
jgi:peptidoglycan hydrolase CwlO-like protein